MTTFLPAAATDAGPAASPPSANAAPRTAAMATFNRRACRELETRSWFSDKRLASSLPEHRPGERRRCAGAAAAGGSGNDGERWHAIGTGPGALGRAERADP